MIYIIDIDASQIQKIIYIGSGRSNASLSVGNNMGVIIHSFNLNISPKMSHGVLECDIVVLQNYMPMVL